MKLLLLAISCLSFCSCAGPRIYTTVTGPDGRTTTKPLALLNADITGEISLKTAADGSVTLDVTMPTAPGGGVLMTERVVLNKKGDAVLGTERIPVVAGINTSGPTEAWGNAFSKSVRSFGAVAGTVLAGFAGIEAANGAAAATVNAIPR